MPLCNDRVRRILVRQKLFDFEGIVISLDGLLMLSLRFESVSDFAQAY